MSLDHGDGTAVEHRHDLIGQRLSGSVLTPYAATRVEATRVVYAQRKTEVRLKSTATPTNKQANPSEASDPK